MNSCLEQCPRLLGPFAHEVQFLQYGSSRPFGMVLFVVPERWGTQLPRSRIPETR